MEYYQLFRYYALATLPHYALLLHLIVNGTEHLPDDDHCTTNQPVNHTHTQRNVTQPHIGSTREMEELQTRYG
uniref:Putative secreted protein n=1 Tax=Anopheles triannulatus TaxID=58253 RepID=A0A2M4B239_9DIPT